MKNISRPIINSISHLFNSFILSNKFIESNIEEYPFPTEILGNEIIMPI